MTVEEQITINGRYRLLEVVGSGGMGTVHKAYDRLTGQNVALKQVRIDHDLLRGDTQTMMNTTSFMNVMLANEFKTLASLRHPNIISVLDYGFDKDKMPYFTMELLPDSLSILEAAVGKPLDYRVNLIIQALQALRYLHHRGIVHCDIKPDNIRVIHDEVRLLDFGLAIARRNNFDEIDDSDDEMHGMIRGTLPYVAPEVLQSGITTELTDIYSMGMISYEIIHDRYPFDRENVTNLIQDILFTAPPYVQGSENPSLTTLVNDLLEKKASDRLSSVREVIESINDIMGYDAEIGSVSIRESFLQAADFVGRAEEIARLTGGIELACQNKGSVWLIGGESGVGKTRLVEEIRTAALVRGLLVFRGGASKEDGSAHLLWHDIMTALGLQSKLSDREVSLLKTLVPNLDTLLGRKVSDLANQNPEKRKNDVLQVFEDLLRRQTRPILLILEDLHWVGEGLRYLQHLIKFVDSIPVMIVGSYRDDERPDLPNIIPGTNLLSLSRFADEEITRLSVSMLGKTLGERPEIVNLLRRETEGNVFFVVQVLEALADEAGDLDNIDIHNLPEHIFTGGIDQIIQRRIDRLPKQSYDLLVLAAIHGREIDRRLLMEFTSEQKLTRWLSDGLSAHVFEVDGQRWSFAHDKIRDAILRKLDNERFKQLHHVMATTIEKIYADSLSYHTTRLAHHWEKSGDLVKAIHYIDLNALKALQQFENQEVISHINRICALVELVEADNKDVDDLLKARWQRMIGEAKYAMRIIDESSDHFNRALSFLNIKGTTVRQEEFLEAAQNYEHLVPIYLFAGDWDKAGKTMREASRIYRGLGQHQRYMQVTIGVPWIDFLRGHFADAFNAFDKNIQMSREQNLPLLLVPSIVGKALSAARIGDDKYLQQAVQLIDEAFQSFQLIDPSQNQYDQIRLTLQSTAAVIYLRNGEFDKAREWSLRNFEHIKLAGDSHYLSITAYTGMVETLLGIADAGHILMDEVANTKIIRDAIKFLHQYAQVVPLARPAAWNYQAWLYILNNKTDRAIETLKVALQEAHNLNMPYDEAIGLYLQGRSLPEGSLERPVCFKRAEQSLIALGARWSLKLIDAVR